MDTLIDELDGSIHGTRMVLVRMPKNRWRSSTSIMSFSFGKWFKGKRTLTGLAPWCILIYVKSIRYQTLALAYIL